jgi:NTP pyrophosphatase (non-canonical NTP hydrolase)
MNLSDFQVSAERTMVAGMPSEQLMVNAALGHCGEIAELDQAVLSTWGKAPPLFDEAGDVLWYVAQMCKAMGKSIAAIPPEPGVFLGWDTETTIQSLYRNTGWIADATKKRVFHGKLINPFDMLAALQAVVGGVEHILSISHLRLEAALDRNHEKRALRHPMGFSHATANARADEECQQ